MSRSVETGYQNSLFKEPELWTYTKLKSLRRCPLEFKVRFLEGQEHVFSPSGAETTTGRLLHGAVAEYYKFFEANSQRRYAALVEAYDRRKPASGNWNSDPLHEQRLLQALRIFSNSPISERRSVEHEVAYQTSIAGVVFRGRADFLIETSESGALSLTEMKTTALEVNSEMKSERFLQPALCYMGLPVDLKSRTKALAIYVFETGSLEEITIDSALLESVARLVGQTIPLAHGPSFPGRINAFCRSCGYNNVCPVYHKESR